MTKSGHFQHPYVRSSGVGLHLGQQICRNLVCGSPSPVNVFPLDPEIRVNAAKRTAEILEEHIPLPLVRDEFREPARACLFGREQVAVDQLADLEQEIVDLVVSVKLHLTEHADAQRDGRDGRKKGGRTELRPSSIPTPSRGCGSIAASWSLRCGCAGRCSSLRRSSRAACWLRWRSCGQSPGSKSGPATEPSTRAAKRSHGQI